MEGFFASPAPHIHRTRLSAPPPPPTVLLHALDHAVQSLKHAGTPTPRLIHSLRAAHEAIASFLARVDPAEDEPMLEGAVEEEEADTGRCEVPRSEVDLMEERMQECSINSKSIGKRRKRSLPLSWPTIRVDNEEPAVEDTIGRRRLDAIDLVFQFYG